MPSSLPIPICSYRLDAHLRAQKLADGGE